MTDDRVNIKNILEIVDDSPERGTFEGTMYPNDEIDAESPICVGTDAADSLEVSDGANDPDGPLDAGAYISLIWNSSDVDSSATLFEYEVQDR